MYSEFKSSELNKKTVKLFKLSTGIKVVMKSAELQKTSDINKETLAFMRTIDIARLRGYNLDLLLQHELTSTLFCLEKVENMRKSEKSELLRELKCALEEIPEAVEIGDTFAGIIFELMAYCHKLPVKKLNFRTYEDFSKYLWSIFKNLSSNANRIDIVFDVHLMCIQQQERNRQEMSYCGKKDQRHQEELSRRLQNVFITWLCDIYSREKPIY